MKALIFFSSLILIVTSCKQDRPIPDSCVACEGELVTKSYGQDSTVTIYNVITPNIYMICDTMYIDSAGDYRMPANMYDSLLCEEDDYLLSQLTDCPCRCFTPKFDHWDKKNSLFVIDGIELFPSNKLELYIPGNKTVYREYKNYQINGFKFNGYFSAYEDNGRIYKIKAFEGQLDYKLVLYKDEDARVAIDSLYGSFLVIRTPQVCDVNGAMPRDMDDPMLIPGSFDEE